MTVMQGERYSIGYFVWPRYKDVIQGPQKKYPGITFARFMDVKSKGFGYVLSPEQEAVREGAAHQRGPRHAHCERGHRRCVLTSALFLAWESDQATCAGVAQGHCCCVLTASPLRPDQAALGSGGG